jgi:4-hydroxy-4-methyl-2-oxoglutarate aldolase
MTWPAERLRGISAATLHESGATPLPPQVHPLDPGWRVCGRAFTVDLAPGHNIWLHRAIYAAQPRDVLVAATSGAYEYGYWGDVLTHAAIARELGGLIIDGSVRDSADLLRLGFPVFARGLCVRGTGKDASAGGLGMPITVGSVTVRSGDVVIGDADGIVVVSPAQIGQVVDRAALREKEEETIRKRISAGESTLDIYGLK